MRLLKGHEYATVYRSTTERDRYGDRTVTASHQIGPGMVNWSPGTSAVRGTGTYPIEATVNEPTMLFRQTVPDVKIGDEVELPNGSRYRVVAVLPWAWGSNGKTAGTEVRFSGVVQ